MVGKYPIVTLCGSTRFKDAFKDAQNHAACFSNSRKGRTWRNL